MARVPAKRSRTATPARRPSSSRPAAASPAASPASPARQAEAAAPGAGAADLAGSLRTLLGSVEAEVQAVSELSEQIDDLVRKLNEARDEQARRLLVLDALRGSVDDTHLGSFLDKSIRPRRTRVTEVIPERLTEGA